MPDVTAAITNTVSISQFNRGLAGKIFEDVRKNGTKVVIKNNEPAGVIMSTEEYLRIMDELEDARLLAIAMERMAHFDPAAAVPAEEVWQKAGLTEEDLADFEDVEIE